MHGLLAGLLLLAALVVPAAGSAAVPGPTMALSSRLDLTRALDRAEMAILAGLEQSALLLDQIARRGPVRVAPAVTFLPPSGFTTTLVLVRRSGQAFEREIMLLARTGAVAARGERAAIMAAIQREIGRLALALATIERAATIEEALPAAAAVQSSLRELDGATAALRTLN